MPYISYRERIGFDLRPVCVGGIYGVQSALGYVFSEYSDVPLSGSFYQDSILTFVQLLLTLYGLSNREHL
jgi:hypothetical protein